MPTLVLSYRSLGFSVLMFIGTVWALTYKRRPRDVNRLIAGVTIMLFVLSTAVSFLLLIYCIIC